MKATLFCIFLVLTLFCQPLFAITMPNLFEVEVPVNSQSPEERGAAVKVAFKQMLARLTGNSQLNKNVVIKEAFNRAEYYVQEYRYSSANPEVSTLLFHVQFESNDVKRLLKKANVTLWSEERPLILVWLALADKNGVPELVGVDSPAKISIIMMRQSKKIGLPLIFPMMDVEDMGQVSVDQVIRLELPQLIQASKRYAPNAYLIGVIQQTKEGYDSHWELLYGSLKWSWDIPAKTPKEITSLVINQISQVFAHRFAVTS